MSHDHRPIGHRSSAGWPALLAICVLIAGVLYLTLGRNEPAARVKPATGSAQAMALAAEQPGTRR
ncbi:hypothetical protein F4693_000297 [Sphingomonas endophytica]|jgi:hypothetical protein|uniref:Uncharacterized protein n=1 Tax=Sphingomonas endophytica TaxID=869719 RepID=A0A7X0J988_9SPHN|nr:hypothetical protein [Sphingomonas endophytica]MBB6503348.1 hypothetical protein [Sphingomonas endophytica]